jgi:predicted nucleotidyltransferase
LAVKTSKHDEYREVAYSSLRWEQLKILRSRAVWVMEALDDFNLHSITHGSIARGDVNQGSDVDVYIPEVQSSFIVETALEKAKIPINSRLIVQATPTYAMKAHVEIDEKTSVSFPLMEMRRVEREFYGFGGEINLNQIRMNARVAGVDKRLMLIDPTDKGHVETCVVGKEESAAKTLGIAAETVLDRVHTLMKRDSVGRTGVFVKKELLQDETFEWALKKLADMNPAVRRRMEK